MFKALVFLYRDGTIINGVDLLHKREDIKLLQNSVEAIKLLNKHNFAVVIVTNQPVVARNLCNEETVVKLNQYLVDLLKKKGARIDAVYYCPHHPEQGHPEANNPVYRRKCHCRKPEIGMLVSASKDLNLSLLGSFLIGDTTVDIQTAKNAKISSILVKTGYAGRDKKYKVKPDYVCNDLLDAAKIISEVEL